MEFKSMKCPNCNGPLEVEDGLDQFFCKYCGYKIILDGQSDAAYNAKTKIKGMEHEEKMADKKYAFKEKTLEIKEKKAKREMLIPIAWIALALIPFLLLNVYFWREKASSNAEESKLQGIVNEIMVDIENQEYDDAYIKAKSLKYTSGWSNEIEDKWDDTREALINQIIEAEKKTTGESTHKPEKKGLFDGWFD